MNIIDQFFHNFSWDAVGLTTRNWVAFVIGFNLVFWLLERMTSNGIVHFFASLWHLSFGWLARVRFREDTTDWEKESRNSSSRKLPKLPLWLFIPLWIIVLNISLLITQQSWSYLVFTLIALTVFVGLRNWRNREPRVRTSAEFEDGDFDDEDIRKLKEQIKTEVAEVLLDLLAPSSSYEAPDLGLLPKGTTTDIKNLLKREAEKEIINKRKTDAAKKLTVEADDDYFTVKIDARGVSEEQVEKLLPKIASATGTYDADILEHDGPRNIIIMDLHRRIVTNSNPLVGVNGFAYPTQALCDFRHIPFAQTIDGQIGYLGMEESNVLVGGAPGGGKSVGERTYIRGVAQLDNVAIIGIDVKKVELAPWDPRLSARAKTQESAYELIQLVVAEMRRRYEWMEDMGIARITPEIGKQYGFPYLFLPIDELAMLTAFVHPNSPKEDKDIQAGFSIALRQVISEGRAAGISMMVATQKPSAKILDTDFRDMFQQAAIYKTRSTAMTDMIGGAGMAAAGADAHLFNTDKASKGLVYIVTEDSEVPIAARTFFTPDGAELEKIVQQVAHKRVDLPWLADFNAKYPTRKAGVHGVNLGKPAVTVPGISVPKPSGSLPQFPQTPQVPAIAPPPSLGNVLAELGIDVDDDGEDEFVAPPPRLEVPSEWN